MQTTRVWKGSSAAASATPSPSASRSARLHRVCAHRKGEKRTKGKGKGEHNS